MGRRGPKPKPKVITQDQAMVLRLVGEGCTNPQIAEQLQRPRHWVADQLKATFRILGVRSRAQAVMAAVAAGILRTDRPRAKEAGK